jgi:hypothetical protein
MAPSAAPGGGFVGGAAGGGAERTRPVAGAAFGARPTGIHTLGTSGSRESGDTAGLADVDGPVSEVPTAAVSARDISSADW